MNKIQKLLLGLAASAVISPVFAEGDNQYYVTVGGGLVMQGKSESVKTPGVTSGDTTTQGEVTFKKPDTSGQILVGVGYYLVENFRLEAVFVKPFVGDSKISSTMERTEVATGKMKGEINSLQLRGYFDVADISDLGKAYFGVGLGWAQVKPKISLSSIAKVASGQTPAGPSESTSVPGKKTNNLAWLVGVGASFDIADGVKLGVEYNYQGFGTGKFKEEAVPANATPDDKAAAAKAKQPSFKGTGGETDTRNESDWCQPQGAASADLDPR